MHFIFAAVRLFPFWAIPIAMILWEMTFYFRRKKHPGQYATGTLMIALLVISGLWFICRGDLHADAWTKMALGLK